MLLFAQTDPAWEYWATSTYLLIAVAITLIAVSAAWLVLRYWRRPTLSAIDGPTAMPGDHPDRAS